MAVRLHDERSFAAPARALFALWTDPAFQRARSRHLGTLEARCERREDPLILVLDEVRDTGWPPHLFESRHTQRWDAESMTARWELRQTGGPGEARAEGTLAIVADGADRCRLVLDGTLSVRVRWLGPMIERLAVPAFRAERKKEAAFVAETLFNRRDAVS